MFLRGNRQLWNDGGQAQAVCTTSMNTSEQWFHEMIEHILPQTGADGLGNGWVRGQFCARQYNIHSGTQDP